jgi:hypothetical protein
VSEARLSSEGHSLSVEGRAGKVRDLSGWQDKASKRGALTNCRGDSEIEPAIEEYSIEGKGKELPGQRNIASK